jgi:glycerophosphoryl diester phosphodiesterase
LQDDATLKAELLQCANTIKTFERKDFAIGHRGACLQNPEHTLESYNAALNQGAGIVECDVIFTKDRQLVCRHAQCDLHTTTNVLATPLAAKCTRPPTTFPVNATTNPICCTSDFTLAEIKTLCAKMDAFNGAATSIAGYLGGTPTFRTELYTFECPKVPTHKEYIQFIKAAGAKFTPELKTPEVRMPFEGNYTQQIYAQQMINEYIEAGVPPKDVWPQSFLEADIYYWVANTTYGAQAVALDGDDGNFGNQAVINAYLDRLVANGAKIVAPPTYKLVEPDTPGGKLGMKPAFYALAAKARNLGIITWTLERSGDLRTGGGYYYQGEGTVNNGIGNSNGDLFVMLDTLYREVGIIGVFSDWSATTTFYSNCVERCRPTYTLFNAATDAVFADIKFGATIPCVPAQVNIRVTFPCESTITTPVVLNLYGSSKELIHSRREGVAPYFLYGDSGADVLAGVLTPRAYSIQSTVNNKLTDPVFFQVGGTCA